MNDRDDLRPTELITSLTRLRVFSIPDSSQIWYLATEDMDLERLKRDSNIGGTTVDQERNPFVDADLVIQSDFEAGCGFRLNAITR